MTPLKFTVSAAILSTALSAFAGNKLIKESRDWALWETESNGKTICYLQANTDDYYFLILKNKNAPANTLDVMMQLPSNPRQVTGMVATLPGLSTQMAFADINGKKVNFWGIPKNLTAFMEVMKAGNQKIHIKSAGGKKEENLDISTRGFADVLREMESRCNSGSGLVNPVLERDFLGDVADAVNPALIDVNKATQLRNMYYGAFATALQITDTNTQLNAVLQKYKPLTDELAQNRANAGRIENSDLPAARANLASAQKLQVDSRNLIAQVDAQTPALTAKIQASQKAADSARAIRAPFEPEYNRITTNLNNSQQALADAQNRLSYIDTRLRDGAQQISSLDYEARSIDNGLVQKRNDLNYARQILRDAQNRRAGFNVSWERDQRLRSNFDYSRAVNERNSLDGALRQAQQEAMQARRERDQAAQALQQCRMQPAVLTEGFGGFPGGPGHGPGGPGGPGGGFPGGPGHGPGHGPGGPGQPPPFDPGQPPVVDPGQPPAPARDCSSFEQALAGAEAQSSQKENVLRDISGRRNNADARVNQIERQVDYEVQRIYDGLVSAEQSARSDADRRENDVNNDDSRIAQIRNSDIPRLQSEQSQLNAERPGVTSNISNAGANISRLTQELTKFKASSDWDRKSAAVDSTARQLSQDQAALANAQAQKASAQSNLQSGAVTEAQTKAQIDSLNSQLASLNSRAAELQRGIAGLPAERAPYDAKIAGLQAQLKGQQNDFLNLLR